MPLHGLRISCVDPGALSLGYSLSVRSSRGTPQFGNFFRKTQLALSHFFSLPFCILSRQDAFATHETMVQMIDRAQIFDLHIYFSS